MIEPMQRLKLLAMLGLPLVLAACATRPVDHVGSCMFEVNAPGSYSYPAGVLTPDVTPDVGGTEAGAAALETCARAKAVAAAGSRGLLGSGVRRAPAQTVTAATAGQVGADAPYGQSTLATPVQTASPLNGYGYTSSCPARASVIYGGAGYCTQQP